MSVEGTAIGEALVTGIGTPGDAKGDEIRNGFKVSSPLDSNGINATDAKSRRFIVVSR